MLSVNIAQISIIIILLTIILLIATNFQIVSQSKEYVIERLGSYKSTWGTGFHVKLPFIDVVRNKVSLKERVIDFPPQPAITKDNVTIQLDTVIFYQVTDSKLYTYGVEFPIRAIENLTSTTLRNIIGDLELDHTLTSRDVINNKVTTILDEASDKWGIKVNRVEIKNIIPPKEIQDAMERQMKAERERRQIILQSEGKKNSDILLAEGEKKSKILRAEAEKDALILHAQAVKEKLISEAEGKAKAIEIVQKAIADGLEMIKKVNPSKEVIALQSLKTFEKVADGKSTKIIIPSEIQSLAGFASTIKSIVSNDLKENISDDNDIIDKLNDKFKNSNNTNKIKNMEENDIEDYLEKNN